MMQFNMKFKLHLQKSTHLQEPLLRLSENILSVQHLIVSMPVVKRVMLRYAFIYDKYMRDERCNSVWLPNSAHL